MQPQAAGNCTRIPVVLTMPSHPKRAAVNVEQRLLLLDIGGFLLADPNKLAQHLYVEAGRLWPRFWALPHVGVGCIMCVSVRRSLR